MSIFMFWQVVSRCEEEGNKICSFTIQKITQLKQTNNFNKRPKKHDKLNYKITKFQRNLSV